MAPSAGDSLRRLAQHEMHRLSVDATSSVQKSRVDEIVAEVGRRRRDAYLAAKIASKAIPSLAPTSNEVPIASDIAISLVERILELETKVSTLEGQARQLAEQAKRSAEPTPEVKKALQNFYEATGVLRGAVQSLERAMSPQE